MTPSVAVIGTGFGGVAAVIELKKRGVHDIVVLEKADDVGGVWAAAGKAAKQQATVVTMRSMARVPLVADDRLWCSED